MLLYVRGNIQNIKIIPKKKRIIPKKKILRINADLYLYIKNININIKNIAIINALIIIIMLSSYLAAVLIQSFIRNKVIDKHLCFFTNE
jgi:hypothetical protein